MQNRNMFLYRRQGPKKRAKAGPSRKNRAPQKGLPNSARDLLPMIQPATKALAQMLAGRTGSSGQLGHARAVLAQTDRLVSDRAHNRLNPAEREEFFEQIARLKLTLADAESEAEVQAMEDEAPPSVPTKVDRARLKEMAMALTSSGSPTSFESRHDAIAPVPEDTLETTSSTSPTENDASEVVVSSATKSSEDPNQLRLPRSSAERVAIQPDATLPRTNGRRRLAKPEGSSSRVSKPGASGKAESSPEPQTSQVQEGAANGSANSDSQNPRQKLPKGWIIDDEGFVVPGPTA